jgi:hypothetical protein
MLLPALPPTLWLRGQALGVGGSLEPRKRDPTDEEIGGY